MRRERKGSGGENVEGEGKKGREWKGYFFFHTSNPGYPAFICLSVRLFVCLLAEIHRKLQADLAEMSREVRFGPT